MSFVMLPNGKDQPVNLHPKSGDTEGSTAAQPFVTDCSSSPPPVRLPCAPRSKVTFHAASPYCAVTVMSFVTLAKSTSHPMSTQPCATDTSGTMADLPLDTDCNSSPPPMRVPCSPRLKVTSHSERLYRAETVRSFVTLAKSTSQPTNIQSLSGSTVGARADIPLSTVCDSVPPPMRSPCSPRSNVTVWYVVS